MHIPYVEWIGGTAGLLTTVSFVPQVQKVVQERRTAGISVRMYVAFTVGVLLWFFYGFLIGSLSIIIANGVTLLLAGTVLGMKIYLDYGPAGTMIVQGPEE